LLSYKDRKKDSYHEKSVHPLFAGSFGIVNTEKVIKIIEMSLLRIIPNKSLFFKHDICHKYVIL